MLDPIPFDQGRWLNPPPDSAVTQDCLSLTTAAETDFWRETHYGFTPSNGHALLFDMPRTYVAEITFTGQYTRQYEQAGLLLWEDETRWIKAGIENADGRANLAAVVTDGRSDWSMAPAEITGPDCTIRITVTDKATMIHARVAGRWQILRVTGFTAKDARLGPMACSPLNAGLTVSFSNFRMGPVPDEPLYLDT